MKAATLCIIALSTILLSTGSSVSHQQDPEINYCDLIQTLVNERDPKWSGYGTNMYANKIVPLLVKKSGIRDQARKGTYGYDYQNDSTFQVDIKRWKEYFKCN